MNLTKKEKLIYNTIIEKGICGYSELAQYLFLSRSTINTHMAHIFQKAHVNSIAKLIYKHFTEEG